MIVDFMHIEINFSLDKRIRVCALLCVALWFGMVKWLLIQEIHRQVEEDTKGG